MVTKDVTCKHKKSSGIHLSASSPSEKYVKIYFLLHIQPPLVLMIIYCFIILFFHVFDYFDAFHIISSMLKGTCKCPQITLRTRTLRTNFMDNFRTSPEKKCPVQIGCQLPQVMLY